MKKYLLRALGDDTVKRLVALKLRWDFCRRDGFAHWRMSRFTGLQGFLMDSEAVELCRIARSLPHDHPCIVEIGSWVGKSSVVIGAALAKKTGAEIHCVDPFDGTAGSDREVARFQLGIEQLERSLRETFEHNVQSAGIASLVIPHQGLSFDVVKSWNKPIDFLFIDGNHDIAAVRRDFIEWSPWVKDGGVIAFHDVWFEPPPNTPNYWTGPAAIVKELVLTSATWQQVAYVNSVFVCRKINIPSANPS